MIDDAEAMAERLEAAAIAYLDTEATMAEAAVSTALAPGVHGIRDRGVGHVFNAVNQRGAVRFLDGQTGTEASFAGFSRLRFLRTYP